MVGDIIYVTIILSIVAIIFYYKGAEARKELFNLFKRKKPVHSTELDAGSLEAIKQVAEAYRKKTTKNQRSRTIAQNVKDKVWNRDDGKCVQCGSNKDLEFDHIIPFAKGGANTYRNLQLLCEYCNRSKSDKIG